VWALAAMTSFATASCLLAQVPGYTITTVAGGGSQFSTGDGGPATSAFLYSPAGIAVDASGDIYIVDTGAGGLPGLIRKVSPSGIISNVAGGGTLNGSFGDGGPATSAALNGPLGVALDTAGNVYIAETANNSIRRVSTTGTITTVAGPGSTNGALGDGGPATGATLSNPAGVALDGAGKIYIADTGHNRVRKVSLDGTITTVAGNGSSTTALGDGGQATEATVSRPAGIAVDSAGNLYIADAGHNRIRRVSTAGIITTVAGNGSAAYSGDGGLATLAAIRATSTDRATTLGVTVDATGNLYIADSGNNRVRVVTTDGKINTIAGNGSSAQLGDNGPATGAGLGEPTGMALGSGGKIYVSQAIPFVGPGVVRLLIPSATPVFPVPSIEDNGVFSASAFGPFPQTALGSWVEIYGSYLSSNSRSWGGADFNGVNAPTSLDGTSVTIGGQPAFISYISPGQINAQVPTNSGTGAQPLIVTTSAGKSATYSVTVNGVEPGLLAPASFKIGSTQYVVALFPDNATYVLPAGAIAGVASRPAKAGETITLYGVGFGAVAPNIPAGQIVQPGNALVSPFVLKFGFGLTQATVTYAGLAPGLVGLYQFNVIVPQSSGAAVPLNFTLGGVSGTQQLSIPVQ
jgi:uncharacterized protein (TIGR03437 family)